MNENFGDTTLIIPTLNEEGNIGKILDIVQKDYPGISIIVSDDGSKDKTVSIVKSFASKNRNIFFLDRKDKKIKGLSASVIDGILNSRTPIFVVIDGDLQHPPHKIREIVENARKGHALVIGCRKSLSSEWPMHRVLMSRVATMMGRFKLMLKGNDSSDIMSGFFGAQTGIIQELIRKRYSKFKLDGYKILFDILDIYPGRLKIKEVYYDFDVRQNGKSKMGNAQILAYMRSLFR